MTSLREFIQTRRSELAKSLASLEAQRATILAEIAELDAAESALRAPVGEERTQDQHDTQRMAAMPTVSASDDRKFPPIRPGSIKDWVISVLRSCPEGADANRILTLINERFGEAIERTSLSPQLSRLKKEERITLVGKVWHLVQNNEAPDVAASGASETGGTGVPSNESRGGNTFD